MVGATQPAGAAAGCSLSFGDAPMRPRNAELFGFNSVNAAPNPRAYDAPELLALARALNLGAARYPGGTVANFWYWPNSSWVGSAAELARDCQVCAQLAAAAQPPPDAVSPSAFIGGFAMASPVASPGGPVWVLNMLVGAAGVEAQLRSLKRQGVPVARIELGNELFSHRYRPQFASAQEYLAAARPAAQLARRLFPAARLAAPLGYPFCGEPERHFDDWNQARWRTWSHLWRSLASGAALPVEQPSFFVDASLRSTLPRRCFLEEHVSVSSAGSACSGRQATKAAGQ